MRQMSRLLLPVLALSSLTSCVAETHEKYVDRFTGRVVDAATGEPVGAAEVEVFYENDRVASGTTGADGRFAVPVERPFEKILWILPPIGTDGEPADLPDIRVRVTKANRVMYDNTHKLSGERDEDGRLEHDLGEVRTKTP